MFHRNKTKNIKRLHLGCGADKKDGWINVDIDRKNRPDIRADASNLKMFKSGTIDTIECCHLLEHLTYSDALKALKEWHRIIRLGGKLYLELPDLDRCLEILVNERVAEAKKFAMIGLFGDALLVERDGISQLHKWAWSFKTLGVELKKVGFNKIKKIPITQTWRKATKFKRDMRLECSKYKSI